MTAPGQTVPLPIVAPRPRRTSRLLGTGLLLLVSLLLSIAAGEILLRAFTPFPVGTKSHRIPDPDLGYRLTPSRRDVDAFGFRNPAGQKEGYRIAAIGDSNTYGNNVQSGETWPAQLQRMSGRKTYNYGIGGYGVYSYHALFSRALEDGAQDMVFAMFPGNDFGAVWSHCDIAKAQSDFWRKEEARLHLESLASTRANGGLCNHAVPTMGWKSWIAEHSAIASAVRMLVISALRKSMSRRSDPVQSADYFLFPDGIPPISRQYVAENATLTDFAAPDTARLLNDFGRFAEDWSKRAPGRVGFLIVPSKERMIFEALRRHGAIKKADPLFVRSVEQEIALERRIVELADLHGIAVREAIGPMAAALEDAIRRKQPFYPEDDGHPYHAGYAALAATGTRLLNMMHERETPQ